jgi:hypothetical protein
LIIEEQIESYEYVVLLDEELGADAACPILETGQASQMLLVEARPRRLVIMAILPSFATRVRAALAGRSISEDRLGVLSCDGQTDWSRIRCLGLLLQQKRDAEVLLLCQRFGGRRWRCLIDALLPEDAARRIHIRGLAHHAYDETNWWQLKPGILKVFDSYLAYVHVKLFGEDEEWQPWDPDACELQLR